MATSNNALISVRQLTKEFRRGVVALDHCDLEVYRGEVVAIIGPSALTGTKVQKIFGQKESF